MNDISVINPESIKAKSLFSTEPLSPVLVFDQNQIESITDTILEDNGIAPGKRGSKEAMNLWNVKRPGA